MKNNEYLSVKQFSERAGVSSQAVYKQLNNKLKKFKKVENGKTYVNIRGLSCFVSTNSTNVVQPVEQLSTNVEQPVEQMIELLKEQLKARKSQEERKARTKRLIEIGAAVESVLGRPIEHDELPKLIDFLKTQEQRGHFFSKAMNKDSQNYNSNNDEQD